MELYQYVGEFLHGDQSAGKDRSGTMSITSTCGRRLVTYMAGGKSHSCLNYG